MNKATVRQTMREKKRTISTEEKQRLSESIMQRIESEPKFAEAKVVLLYWSMVDEVQTHALVDRWYKEKTVLLPCVDGEELRLRQYTGRECLVEGEQFGIGEPTGEECTEMEKIDLIVVPGVAFDRQCNRMGRGRGFYDRLLKNTPKACKIGIGYDFQLLESIPVDPFDVPMNIIITDRQTISKQ